MADLKKTMIKGTIWSISGQLVSLIIVLITNIWLARLLSPKEFGQVGIIMFFITLANVFTESGLGGALVRKKQVSQNDYSTVFVVNLVLSILCFILIIFGASFVADYYNDALLRNLLIVSALILIINAFQLTQNAKLISEMKFREKSTYRFISVLVSSVIGIIAVYQGVGVWALVLIQLLTAGINTVLLWVFEGFFMRVYFSKTSFKELYSFGLNTTLASLINITFDNIYQLILAKYFSLSQTGYYYQAKKLQDVPGGIINMLTQSVVFSTLAKLQDDKIAFIKAYNKITLYFLVLLGFISTFIYVYAEQIVLLLYGTAWIGAIFYMQLLTIASFFYMQESINRVIFKVFNQTRQILYLEYIKKTIQAISIFIGVYYLDIKILIIGFVITSVIGYLINYYYSRRIIGSISIYELFTIFKVTALSVMLGCFILFLYKLFDLTGFYQFFSLPFLILLYIIGLYLLRIMNVKIELNNILKLYSNDIKTVK